MIVFSVKTFASKFPLGLTKALIKSPFMPTQACPPFFLTKMPELKKRPAVPAGRKILLSSEMKDSVRVCVKKFCVGTVVTLAISEISTGDH
jgi:hypothetical protein